MLSVFGMRLIENKNKNRSTFYGERTYPKWKEGRKEGRAYINNGLFKFEMGSATFNRIRDGHSD